MMKAMRFAPVLMLTAAMTLGGLTGWADDAKPEKPKGERPPMREGMGPRGMRGGMREMNPEFMMAMMVQKELKAYQKNPTDENYAALEKAFKEKSEKFAKRRKDELAKQIQRMTEELKNFDQNQAKASAEFLTKVKKGEFKMPERPPMRDGKGPGARPEGDRERRGTPDGELPPPPMPPEE